MQMLPFDARSPAIREAAREVANVTCRNARFVRDYLLQLQFSLGNADQELAQTETDLLRFSNVSSERFLSRFLSMATRMFNSPFRLRLLGAIRLSLTREDEFFVMPPTPMEASGFVCGNAFVIRARLREIDRRLAAIQAVFNRMEPAFLADADRIAMVRGSELLSIPEGDPGRGTRVLSAAEQIALGTVRVVRMELANTLRLIQSALQEIMPVITPAIERPRFPGGFPFPM